MALIVWRPDGLLMATVCMFVLKWATPNFEQVSEAAGWKADGGNTSASLQFEMARREASARPRTNASSMFYLK